MPNKNFKIVTKIGSFKSEELKNQIKLSLDRLKSKSFMDVYFMMLMNLLKIQQYGKI